MAFRVLIADDSHAVRVALKAYFGGREDIEICAETRNGREALERALTLKPDLLILDVVMPELNGIEVATVLKHKLPDSKTILFTLYGDVIGKNVAAAAGVNVVLEKSDGLTKLMQVLDCFVRASGD